MTRTSGIDSHSTRRRLALTLLTLITALVGLILAPPSNALSPSPDSRLLGVWKSSGHYTDTPYLVVSKNTTTGGLKVAVYANCAHPAQCPAGYTPVTLYNTPNQPSGARTWTANLGMPGTPHANLIITATLMTSNIVPFRSTLAVTEYVTWFNKTDANSFIQDTYSRSATTFGTSAPAMTGSWLAGDSRRLNSGLFGTWHNVVSGPRAFAFLRIAQNPYGTTFVTPYICGTCRGMGPFVPLTYSTGPTSTTPPTRFLVRAGSAYLLEASYAPATATLKVRVFVVPSSGPGYNIALIETFKK